jgi:pimeloyl-ACP methyl ester carboxylesterase
MFQMKALHRVFAVGVLWLMAMDSEAKNFRENSHDLDGELGRALVLEPSSGRPAAVFVCLHGIQSNKTWWRPLGEQLAARGFAVWAFDRPGSSAPSPAGPADVSATKWGAQMAHVAAQAREAYGKKAPVIAMGVSWGASATMTTTANNGNGWAGAVLCNPAFVTRKDGKFRRTVLLSYLNPVTWFHKHAPLRLPLDLDDYTPNPKTRKLPYFASENLKHTATRRFLVATNRAKKEATHLLATTNTPVLVLAGESDPLVPLEELKAKLAKWRAGNPKVEVETVPSATHAAILEAERIDIAERIERWTRTFLVR